MPPAPPRPWGRWLLAGGALLVGGALVAAWLGLAPWLRRTLERRVAKQTHAQYQLTIGSVRVDLLARAVRLRGLDLRPAAPTLADTLPRLHLRLARLDLSGVGLLALLRGQPVPIDSLVLDSLRVNVEALARRPAPHPGAPFYQRQPLRLGHLLLRHAGGSFGPAGAPVGQLLSADISARDVLFAPAGAADVRRLAFAAAWQATLHGLAGRLGGHRLVAQLASFSSQNHSFVLDSLRVAPPGPGQGKPGAVRVALALPRLALYGLQAATWQHEHRFEADSVRLRGPRLTFRPPAQAPPPLWQLLAPLFSRADLGRLAIDNGYLAVAGVQERPVARHVFAEARGLRVDSAAGQAGDRRIVYARAWAGHTGRLTAVFDAPAYPVSAEHLVLNTEARTLRLSALQVRPAFTPAQLNLRSGYQVSQLGARIDALLAQEVDFYALSGGSQVRMGRLAVVRPWVQLGSDGRGPINPHRSVITPDAMRNLQIVVDVRRLDLRGGTVSTYYRSPRTPLVGRLRITRIDGTLRNVSNDPLRQSFRHPLTGSATAYLQDSCRIQAQLVAPLLDPQGRHRLWGTFGPAPFGILNPMTVPTRLLAFKSGHVRRVRFALNADRRQATGRMWAEYEGLKFAFPGYKNGQVQKTLLGRVKNGVVNGLVVRDNNPRPSGRLVVGSMATRRELRFSVFTLWRQGLIIGLLNSAGVPAKLAQQLGQKPDQGPLPGK
ncbi:hypothetical protein ACFQ48_04305 [Hymenobacter caeli]|uniref:AsmA-like C-terminal domain-containing protein n=1 Tax=Hymenobacter caeli TaxID=2735894 RepID=A0ABX2FPV5_9BACT|nr:hypothetical protein [Hymenobacter caeli]NRT19180.1 hypothetical protein [Hymenobacter caeli]